MGKGLLLASTFSSGLAIYLGAKHGYINPHLALLAMVIWVLAIRYVAKPTTEQIADEFSRQHLKDNPTKRD